MNSMVPFGSEFFSSRLLLSSKNKTGTKGIKRQGKKENTINRKMQ
jgi:hypothetical protein